MTLLIAFVCTAVVFSFLCSIAEAVLLSVDTAYLAVIEQEGKSSAPLWRKLKEEINSPLAVILTLNTIAHTVGAVGAGAQAAVVFGNAYVAVVSALLTLIILVFSEIIPKALGANYWKQLAPVTAVVLSFLVRVLYPFVILSNKLTRWFSPDNPAPGFNRSEFTALAELGEQEGELDPQEVKVLHNLFALREAEVRTAMTPRSVVFSMPEDALCRDLLDEAEGQRFSRIPLLEGPDEIGGFVLRSDALMANASGDGDTPLRDFRRELPAIMDKFSLLKAFDDFVSQGQQIMLVVNEYGDGVGILTLEDILESLIGLEIVDETDRFADMQQLARRLSRHWRRIN